MLLIFIMRCTERYRVKFLYAILLLSLTLFGDTNTTKVAEVVSDGEPVIVKDESGLSDDELREVAKESDTKDDKKVTIKEVFEATDEKGKVDVSALQSWDDLTPDATKYDWIRTKSGEWFKGEIKALYKDSLEFDSEEIGIYVFDLEDIANIKSYNVMSINIEDIAIIDGIIRLKDENIEIIQGDKSFKFKRSQIVSFAPDAEHETDYWSGKITLSLDRRVGNRDQFDYTTQANLKRRTSKTRLVLDYIGRIAKVNSVEITNDHRINEKFDIYLSRNFFWTPFFSEYYTDEYQNIKSQFTGGVGIGYTVIDTKMIDWDISGGPAAMYTEYGTVQAPNEKIVSSPALELSTDLEIELSKIVDFKYNYKLSLTDTKSGKYTHHMVATFENELTSWLDFDITGIWDHIDKPEKQSDGIVPDKNDFQFLLGLGVEF